MKLLSPFYKIRGALAAWRDADPRQAGRLGTVLKFFAVMLVLTLAARGIAGASMPVVTLTSAAASSITQSSTAAGTIAVRGGTPLLVPEGVLVTEVSAAAGQSLQAGDVIARFDAASLAQALAARQAQVRQLETTAAQLQDPETADRFALQQAQQQLDRAYADAQKTWQEGEEAVAEARARRDSAQSALRALQSQPPATPESAEAERQQQIAAAQAELDAAEAALTAAQQSADAANEAAADAAQNRQDARDSAAHSYDLAARDAADATAANQAQAAVTLAQLEAAKAELQALDALQQAGGVLTAPNAGTLTRIDLAAGQNSTAVAGLLADAETGCTLTFALDKDAAKLAAVGTQVTVKQGSLSGQAAITALSEADGDGSVQADVQLESGGWKAGAATVELKLNAGQYPQCLPATAIQQDSTGSFVYLIETRSTLLGQQNVLVRLPVTVEAQGDGMAAVSGSISRQVVSGADKPLSAGAWVRVSQ